MSSYPRYIYLFRYTAPEEEEVETFPNTIEQALLFLINVTIFSGSKILIEEANIYLHEKYSDIILIVLPVCVV